ncbi:MAG: DUF3868 domain-containing protein [Prevotellaceae bacterium]|nr:DUF3868 domain-containing protein [Prevotellaceae bacterium]
MKKHIIRTLVLSTALSVPSLSHADGVSTCRSFAGGGISVNGIDVSQSGGYMTLSLGINLDSLDLPSNNRLVYTPYVKTNDGTVSMPKIVINGRKQQIMYNRGVDAGAYGTDATIVKRENGKSQQVDYVASVPFTSSLLNYDVMIHEDLCGCGDSLDGNDYALKRRRQPVAAFVKPAAEAVKVRHIDKRAYIDFPVDKTELYPEYRRNPAELDSIINTINMVKNDRNLTVSGINIHGYASPESPYEHNDYLARTRAQTLKDYVRQLVKLDDALFSVSHTTEDWDGLRRYLRESNIEHKSEILAIAEDETIDPDAREWRIKMNYPEEYKFMLATWYPALRHSDYHITYKVKPFDVEEAKALIKTKPQQLSQQEMFLVAQTYEPGSTEFNEVMEIAVRMFPDDETANLNAACTRLNAGNADAAKPYLDKAGNSAEADNARGIYEQLKGNESAARSYFKSAKDAGLKAAEENLQNMDL